MEVVVAVEFVFVVVVVVWYGDGGAPVKLSKSVHFIIASD